MQSCQAGGEVSCGTAATSHANTTQSLRWRWLVLCWKCTPSQHVASSRNTPRCTEHVRNEMIKEIRGTLHPRRCSNATTFSTRIYDVSTNASISMAQNPEKTSWWLSVRLYLHPQPRTTSRRGSGRRQPQLLAPTQQTLPCCQIR